MLRTDPLIATPKKLHGTFHKACQAEDRQWSVLSFQLLGGQYARIFCRFVLFLQSTVRIEKDDVMIF